MVALGGAKCPKTHERLLISDLLSGIKGRWYRSVIHVTGAGGWCLEFSPPSLAFLLREVE